MVDWSSSRVVCLYRPPRPSPRREVWRPAVAVDGRGAVHVAWAQPVDGDWEIVRRTFNPADGPGAWSGIVRVTDAPGSDFHVVAATDAAGTVWLAWQGWREDNYEILAAPVKEGEKAAPRAVSESPANDWGDKPGGRNLSGAKKLTFLARGANGGETVTFEFGILGRDKTFFDTATAKLDRVALDAEWKQYSVDLQGKDLTRIKTGFAWVVAGQGAPITFYLDDIRYE